MRLNIADDSVEAQIAQMRREVDELKTPQLTSQNSGMMAYVVKSGLSDTFGDIVYFSTSSNQQQRQTSLIPLPNTGSLTVGHSVSCIQTFKPKHNKPTVVIPILELEVKTNGYYATSQYFADARGWGVYMPVSAGGRQVAAILCNGMFGELFSPIYDSVNFYKYRTDITVASIVSDLELAYKFTCRASDKGTTSSTLTGTW